MQMSHTHDVSFATWVFVNTVPCVCVLCVLIQCAARAIIINYTWHMYIFVYHAWHILILKNSAGVKCFFYMTIT